jgi:hypothetical protein
LRRFLLLSIPLLIVAMGLFQFMLEMLHLQVDPDGATLPGWVRLATWALEALGLSTLFVLVHGRGWEWASGLLTGWIAWVFRGPLLVVAVVGYAGLPPGPWWSLAFRWWVLYSLCGLLLGIVAAAVDLGGEAEVRSVSPLVQEPFPEGPYEQEVEEPVAPEPPAFGGEQE